MLSLRATDKPLSEASLNGDIMFESPTYFIFLFGPCVARLQHFWRSTSLTSYSHINWPPRIEVVA